eukprot:gene6011-7488_t
MVYYDLNIPEQDGSTLRDIFLYLTKLGYDSVAVTHFVEGKITSKDSNNIEKIKLDEDQSPTSSGWMRIGNSSKTLKQYSRLEVKVRNNAELQLINSNNPVVNSYDIVSVIPGDLAIFNACCNSSEIDIITITPSIAKFVIRPEKVRQCIAKGIFIEVLYTNMFEKEADRNSFFGYTSQIVRSSHGKNIIISSKANSLKFLRSPYDLSNLGNLFGMSFDQAKASVSKNPHSALLHAITRRSKGIAITTNPKLLDDLERWKLEKSHDSQPTNNSVPFLSSKTTTTTTTTKTASTHNDKDDEDLNEEEEEEEQEEEEDGDKEMKQVTTSTSTKTTKNSGTTTTTKSSSTIPTTGTTKIPKKSKTPPQPQTTTKKSTTTSNSNNNNMMLDDEKGSSKRKRD